MTCFDLVPDMIKFKTDSLDRRNKFEFSSDCESVASICLFRPRNDGLPVPSPPLPSISIMGINIRKRFSDWLTNHFCSSGEYFDVYALLPNVKLLNGETDSFLIWNVSIGRVGVVLVKKLIKDHLEFFKNALRATKGVAYQYNQLELKFHINGWPMRWPPVRWPIIRI